MSQTSPATEQSLRRKFPRRKFRRGVGFLYQGHYFVGTGFEVGEGGVAFFSDIAIRVGDCVVVSFQLPKGSFVSVMAEVRNIRPEGHGTNLYGCSFRNLKFESKREIRTFVTARSANEQ